jgi:PAS domain S-box-containing protein
MKISQEKALRERIDRLNRENQRLLEKLASIRNDKDLLLKELRDTKKILNEIPSAVLLIQAGCIVLSNETSQRMLRYTEEEFLDCDFQVLFHSKSTEYVKSIQEKWAQDKPLPSQFELYMATKDGEPVRCEVILKKIRYGGRSAYLLYMTDIEKRKIAEEMLLQSQKINAIGRMASGLSRDLNRGLKNFKELFSLIQPKGFFKSKKVIRSLRRIESVVETADSVTQQLSCLAKQAYEQRELLVFDLNKVIGDAISVSGARQGADGQGNVSVSTYPRTFSPVRGNPEEMRDALVCLILNAMDAMPDGGEIYLSVEEHLGFVWIYIQDSGMGIADDVKDKIFDPFFTTKGGRRPGLGLSIAYAIINRHSGQIDVISQSGRGTTFIVKLPLLRQPQLPMAKGVRNSIRDLRILVISDGGSIIDILIEILIKKGGKITTVRSCIEGLKKISGKKNFDLVFTDIDTTDFEEAGIVSKIKKMKNPLPVVLVNPGLNGRSQRLLSRFGQELLIERPIEFKGLSAIISRAMAT